MAGDLKLKAGTLTTIAASGSALATATRVDAGTLDNTSLLAPSVDLVLATGFTVAPTPGSGIVVGCYFVPRVDGVNSADVDTTTPRFPSGTFAGNFVVTKSQTGTQYLTLSGVPLSALVYDVYLDNEAGQQMAAAWSLKAQPTIAQYT